MANLKPGWRRVKFGDVVRLHKETCKNPTAEGIDRYIGLEHLEPGDLRIRSWGDVSDGTTFTSRVRPGQVLFGKRRAYQRKVAVADFDAICSGDIYVFESANPERLLPDLLPFLCQTDSFFEHAVGTSAGSLSPRTNWTSLAEYEFALPPMEEQRLMVTHLLALRVNEDALREAALSIDAVESSLLLSEFGRYSRTLDVKHVHLSRVAIIQSGVAKGRASEPGTTIEVPYLRVANVKDGSLDLSDIQLITVEKNRVQNYFLRTGDVLMTEGGDLDKLGRGTVWQGEIADCVHQNHVFAVRPDGARLSPWYLAALARSPFGRGYFQKCAKRTSNLASVNKQELGQLPIPTTPLSHQHDFTERWIAIRTRRSDIEARIAQLRIQSKCVFGVWESTS